MIIDCHVHAYEHLGGLTGRGEGRAVDIGCEYPNGTYYTCMNPLLGDKQLTIETYIEKFMIPNKIDKGILLQALAYGLTNGYYEDILKRYPGRFLASCTLDPLSPNKQQILDNLMSKNCYSIFKYEMSYEFGWCGIHPELRPDGPEFDDIYELASKKKMCVEFDIGTYPQPSHKPEALAAAAKAHPDINFVCCHLVCPTEPLNDFFKEGFEQLAKCDNIWFDLSCLPHFMNIEDKYPYPEALELIEYAASKVGSERLMWGSDLPCTVINCDFSQIFDFIQHSKKFSSQDLDNIYGNSAMDCYRLR